MGQSNLLSSEPTQSLRLAVGEKGHYERFELMITQKIVLKINYYLRQERALLLDM